MTAMIHPRSWYLICRVSPIADLCHAACVRKAHRNAQLGRSSARQDESRRRSNQCKPLVKVLFLLVGLADVSLWHQSSEGMGGAAEKAESGGEGQTAGEGNEGESQPGGELGE